MTVRNACEKHHRAMEQVCMCVSAHAMCVKNITQ